MAKFVATIYYNGCVEAGGKTEEEAIDNARNQLLFSSDEDYIIVEECAED